MGKKILKLAESDLVTIIGKVLNETLNIDKRSILNNKQIQKQIFKFIELRNLVFTVENGIVFYLKSEKDNFAEFAYDIQLETCYVDLHFVKKIANIFVGSHNINDKKLYETGQVISLWVSQKFGIDDPDTIIVNSFLSGQLRRP
jgi:hypothetical protein